MKVQKLRLLFPLHHINVLLFVAFLFALDKVSSLFKKNHALFLHQEMAREYNP